MRLIALRTAWAPAVRRVLGASVGVLGSEGLAAYLHPALGEALAAADVIILLVIVLILLAAVLCGYAEPNARKKY